MATSQDMLSVLNSINDVVINNIHEFKRVSLASLKDSVGNSSINVVELTLGEGQQFTFYTEGDLMSEEGECHIATAGSKIYVLDFDVNNIENEFIRVYGIVSLSKGRRTAYDLSAT